MRTWPVFAETVTYIIYICKHTFFTEESYFATPDEANIQFEALLTDIAEELSSGDKQNLEKIKVACYCITNGQSKPLLSEEDRRRVTTSKTITDVFVVMRPHWKWCSHRLLLTITNGINCPNAVDLLKQFEKKIDHKMKLKIIYEKFKKKLPIPQGYCKMAAIIDKEHSEITL